MLSNLRTPIPTPAHAGLGSLALCVTPVTPVVTVRMGAHVWLLYSPPRNATVSLELAVTGMYIRMIIVPYAREMHVLNF